MYYYLVVWKATYYVLTPECKIKYSLSFHRK
jgi:hypothetical protein